MVECVGDVVEVERRLPAKTKVCLLLWCLPYFPLGALDMPQKSAED